MDFNEGVCEHISKIINLFIVLESNYIILHQITLYYKNNFKN
jgi:hypothetical protein